MHAKLYNSYSASGRHAAMDATLTDQFAGDAAVGVGISVAGRHGVSVDHSGRLALVGAHVRCGNVGSGSDEVNINHRALEYHQHRQSLQLIDVHICRVTNT